MTCADDEGPAPRMHPDDAGGLRRTADALFRALDEFGPRATPDVDRCDALTPDTDAAHLVALGKLCAQRLYAMGTRTAGYERDAAFILTSTVDLVIRQLNGTRPPGDGDLMRLNAVWARMQDFRMELERLYSAGEP